MAWKRDRRPSVAAEHVAQLMRLPASDIPPAGAVDPRLERFLPGPRHWQSLHRLLSSRGCALPQDQRDITHGGPAMLLEPITLHLYAYGQC